VVAIVGIAVLAIACYRVMGLPLLIVAGAFLGYTYYGQFIPGNFGHAGFSLERVFTQLFYTDNGIIGIPIGVAATFIFTFMLFSAIMQKTGIGQFFMDLATALTGRATGGPAKMVVVVSAMMGMLTGSSVANTVASGSYTIPMMKRMGYEKNFAGAVEASASTGGQIVPPILGAAAFLMAEITGIPYTQIAIAAIIPAVLYFVTIFAAVHFEAKKKNLLGLPADEVPKAWPILKERGHLLLPILAIVVLLARGFTPTTSALGAILTALIVSSFKKETRLSLRKLVDALELGARNCIAIAVACGIAGIVIGVVSMTGLGHAFIQAMMSLGNAIQHEFWRLLMVLVFCMLASLILGLGIPTTAKYVIMAIITAPVLVQMDVPLLAAHMFVFYFGVDADITPPVGLAAYAAAGISKGSPMVTGVIAMRLGIANYIVPFFFIFNPQMLFIEPTFLGVAHAVVVGIICVVAIAAGLSGYFFKPMSVIERVLLVLAGILLAGSDVTTSAIAMVVIVIVFIRQKLASRAA
jgi:TRAP transporter 4TM/12TM fusion protein